MLHVSTDAHLIGYLFEDPPPPTPQSATLTVSVFEVLIGAAPSWELEMTPWPHGSPLPLGAVVVGVSARGDPLLSVLAECFIGHLSAGYASPRDGVANVAIDGQVLRGRW
jgi:hypothetical protein